MRKRILVLPLSAAILFLLVLYKHNQPRQTPTELAALAREFPAPLFQLFDQSSQLVRLERYLGRHRLAIIFFDASKGADGDPLLQQLREEHEKFTAEDIQILAISPLTPYANRQAIERSGPFPFPLLSDPDFRVHREWGAFNRELREPRPALFLINRAGRIAWSAVDEQTGIDAAALLERFNAIR